MRKAKINNNNLEIYIQMKILFETVELINPHVTHQTGFAVGATWWENREMLSAGNWNPFLPILIQMAVQKAQLLKYSGNRNQLSKQK